MIIGICGLIGNGKGTVADYLVEQHNFTKLSFADRLKDGVSTLFGWDRALLEGDTVESREFREKIDEYWTAETGKEVTPRTVLQLYGTECLRRGFFDGIWVSLVKQQILENPNGNFVIPDCRFFNELEMVKGLKGFTWEVWREAEPEYWKDAGKLNREQNPPPEDNHIARAYPDVHRSEWRWAGWNFDFTIMNQDTMGTLYTSIDQVLDRQQSLTIQAELE
jgi:hypothetical protein